MRIGYYVPAYRETVTMAHVYTRLFDQTWASAKGYELAHFHSSSSNIAMQRNWAIKRARQEECNYLMMLDSDCGVEGHEPALKRMLYTMHNQDAALVGLPFIARTRDKVTAEPANPGRVYVGEVGTGCVLIDMGALEDVALPWFVDELTEDGTERKCGEDIHFCRKLEELGKTCIIDYTLPTIHIAEEGLYLNPGDAPETEQVH